MIYPKRRSDDLHDKIDKRGDTRSTSSLMVRNKPRDIQDMTYDAVGYTIYEGLTNQL